MIQIEFQEEGLQDPGVWSSSLSKGQVTPEGCECWTPSLDSPGRLGCRSQPRALATVQSGPPPPTSLSCRDQTAKTLETQFSLTAPPAVASRGATARACAHLGLAANQIAGADTWQPIIGGSGRACRGSCGGDPGLRRRCRPRLNPGTAKGQVSCRQFWHRRQRGPVRAGAWCGQSGA